MSRLTRRALASTRRVGFTAGQNPLIVTACTVKDPTVLVGASGSATSWVRPARAFVSFVSKVTLTAISFRWAIAASPARALPFPRGGCLG